MNESVLTHTSGALCRITLNRPQVLNSIHTEMAAALSSALGSAAADPAVRAILLTGNGKGFCAGQDLAELTAAEESGQPLSFAAVVEGFNRITRAIVEAPKPVVCAVNGVAAGAGANIALAADFVIASERASFVQAFVNVGLIPDSGGTYFLPRLVGMAKAKELVMLGEKISAEEALRLQLIYRTAPDAELLAQAEALALRLAGLPTAALASIKRAFSVSFQNSLSEQLALEKELQVQAGASADYREGLHAFVEKRAAKFCGK
jgi:2-(1,2-epoxy-1,2-dihydrophenyl)acetyl-CoA isomerase